MYNRFGYHHVGDDIGKNQNSNIQTAVDTPVNRATADKFQLNEEKSKELRICFSTKRNRTFDPIVVNDQPIDVVTDAKIVAWS